MESPAVVPLRYTKASKIGAPASRNIAIFLRRKSPPLSKHRMFSYSCHRDRVRERVREKERKGQSLVPATENRPIWMLNFRLNIFINMYSEPELSTAIVARSFDDEKGVGYFSFLGTKFSSSNRDKLLNLDHWMTGNWTPPPPCASEPEQSIGALFARPFENMRASMVSSVSYCMGGVNILRRGIALFFFCSSYSNYWQFCSVDFSGIAWSFQMEQLNIVAGISGISETQQCCQ